MRWGGRGEVKTLRNAEAVSLGLPLSGMMLYSGLYVNELLARVLEQETNYSVLFFDYLQCLQALAAEDSSPEQALRQFELALLHHLGYGLDFLHCAGSGLPVDDAMTYRYREEKALSPAWWWITTASPGANCARWRSGSFPMPRRCAPPSVSPVWR